jgi:hypothetical protein
MEIQSEFSNIFWIETTIQTYQFTQNSGEVTVLPEYFNQNKTIFSKHLF